MLPRFHFAALACVAAIACGQVLFKMVAVATREHQTPFHTEVIALFLLAMAIYISATVGWIWVLQFVSLSRAYPYFALSFVLVPLASFFLFGEELTLQYSAGVALIVGGVLMTVL
jgi:drug/metabolite transporter (DMT)-like permease